MSMEDGRSAGYIATVDDMMSAAILAYAGSASDAQIGELPSIADSIRLIFAEYGEDRAAAAIGQPRATLRRWRDKGELKTEQGRQKQDTVRLAAAKIMAKRDAVAKLGMCKSVTIEFDLVYSSTDEARDVEFKLHPKKTPKQCEGSSWLAGKRSNNSPHNPFLAVAGRYAVGESDLFGPLLAAMEPPRDGDFSYGAIFAQSEPNQYASITAISFG